MDALIVVPSLKVSGGVREALRLAGDLRRGNCPASLLSMWASPHRMETPVPVELLSDWPPRASRAPVELPVLQYRFSRWLRSGGGGGDFGAAVFTHYATLPLCLLVPRRRRFFFVQDLEWYFVGNCVASAALRSVVLAAYRTGRIISANAYLTEQLAKEGLEIAFEAPVWADPLFSGVMDAPRDVDFVMVLRKGAHKRLDLYRQFIALACQHGSRMVAITPEDELATLVRPDVSEVLLRPSADEMMAVYGRSKCFVHLSEHEGFGLPPLEAMGSGCIPLCRDSGGVRAFMQGGALEALLLPLEMPIQDVFARGLGLVDNESALATLRSVAKDRFEAGTRRCADARAHLAEVLERESRRGT